MLIQLLLQSPIIFLTIALAILIAISIHESAHALIALRLGDSTAADHGRISLNPLAHLDPIGTLLLLFIGFGWGKPVPVNPDNLHNPKRDSLIIALAGPISNLMLAVLLAGVYRLTQNFASEPLQTLILITGYFNLLLLFFNLIPIPPLDGSKIIALFAPEYIYEFLERYGYILLLIVIFVSIGGVSLFSYLIATPVQSVYTYLFSHAFPF